MDSIWIWVIIGAAAGLLVWFVKSKALEIARKKYEAALAELAADPENNTKRVAALDAGRAYVQVAKQVAGKKGVAVFDEMALQNDLTMRLGNQAKIASEMHRARPATSDLTGTSRLERLEKLAALRTQGVLSEAEFQDEKAKVLAQA